MQCLIYLFQQINKQQQTVNIDSPDDTYLKLRPGMSPTRSQVNAINTHIALGISLAQVGVSYYSKQRKVASCTHINSVFVMPVNISTHFSPVS